MKKLITYLKALWRRGLDSQRKEVGVISGEATIEHPFSTYSAPFGTCWQPSGRLHSVVRCAAMLVMLFTIGSGNVWGAAEIIYTLDGNTTGGSSGYDTASDIEQDDISWKATGNTTIAPWRLGGKGGSGKNSTTNYTRTIYSTDAIADDVTSIVIETGTKTLNALTNINVKVTTGSNGSGTVKQTFTETLQASHTYTFDKPAGQDWSDCYYLITFTFQAKGTSNQYIQFLSADFYAETSSCEKIGAPTVTATPGDRQISLSWPNQAEASSYTVTCTGGTPGSVTGTTTKSCTITGLTNGTSYTWTVTPVGDGSTYCASGNTAASASATPNVFRTITYYDKDGQHTTSLADGTNIATALTALYGGDDPVSCDATNYEYFVGWKVGEISGTASSVTLLDDEVVNASSPSNNYYAVWSDTDPSAGGSELFSFDGGVAADLTDMTGVTANGFGTDYAVGNAPYRIKLDGTGDYVIIAIASQPSKVTIGVKMIGGNSTSSITVQESTAADGTFTDVETLSISGAQNDVLALETSESFKATTRAVKLYFTKGSNVGLGPITIEGAAGDAEYITTCCDDPGLAYGTASVTKTFGNGTFKNTLTNSHSVSVTYESSNTDVATVASDGTVTIQGAGNATITARFAGNSTYCADEASYTLTVNKASISPTLTYDPAAVTVGSTLTSFTLSGNSGSGSVSYSSSNDAIATVNSSGVVTGVAPGTVTIIATIAATTNYNGNTATSNTITVNAAACTGVNSLHTGNKDQGGWVTNQCFEDADWGAADDAIYVGAFPLTNECYVGWAGGNSYYGAYWAVGGIKTYDIPTGRTLGWNSGNYYESYPGGALGTFHIYKNSKDENYYLRFKPSSYILRTGSNETSWTSREMTVSATNSHYYETAELDLTSTLISEHAYVDLKTSGGDGHVWCNFSNDRTASGNVKVKSSVGDADGNFRGDNLKASDNGTHGKFRIDITKDVDNWKLAFVPMYRITYAAGTGASGSMDPSSYAEISTTIAAAANGFTAPTGKQFNGWSDGVNSYAAGANVTMNSNVTLTAQWTDIDYTVTVSQSPDVSATTTGQTSSAHYNGTINLTVTDIPSGYRFVNWTTSDGFSITNPTSATTASFTMPNKNVTVTANFQQTHTVDWYVGGSAVGNKLGDDGQTTVVDHGGKISDFPAHDPDGSACDKTFVGWTNTSSYVHGTSPLFNDVAGSPTINADANFYAVFAEGGNTEYVLTPAASLTAGEYVIAAYDDANSKYLALTGAVSAASLGSNSDMVNETTGFTISEGKFTTLPTGACEFVLTAYTGETDNGFYIQNPADDKYLDYQTTTNRRLWFYAATDYVDEYDNPTTPWAAWYGVALSKDGFPDNGMYLKYVDETYSLMSNGSGTTFVRGYANDNTKYKPIYLFKKTGGLSGYTITCADCGTSVTPTYTAAPTGGTVSVTKSAAAVASGSTVKTCTSVDLTVTITPASHYTLTGFTTTGLSTGTATISPAVNTVVPTTSAQTFTVTVSAGATGTLNLTPVLTEDAHKVISWVVHGSSASIADGHGTTWVYSGENLTAIPEAPDAPTGCDDKVFVGWSENDRGATEEDASYYDDLFTNLGGAPTGITTDKTFTAVFATPAAGLGGTVMWDEPWTGESDDATPSSQSASATVYNSTTLTYTYSTSTRVKTDGPYAGGTSPELLVKESGGYFTASNIPTAGQTSLTLTYKSNKTLTVSTNTSGVEIGDPDVDGSTYTQTITIDQSGLGVANFDLVFTKTAKSNARLDDIHLEVPGSSSMSGYVTTCEDTWTVTYYKNTEDAVTNLPSPTGISKSTGSGTLSSKVPVRYGYTFDGWATSAGGSVAYAAGAAVSSVSADMDLYAKWSVTPVTEINLSKTSLDKYVGDPSVTLSVLSVLPDGANTSVTWSSSNSSIATVNSSTGEVNFVAEGTANIIATSSITSGTTATCVVTVWAKPTVSFLDNLHSLTEDKDGNALSGYNLTDVAGTPVVFPVLANQPAGSGTCEDEFYVFIGWTTSDNNTDPEDNLVTSHNLTNGDNITYYAVWANGVSGTTYTKLTSSTFKTSPTKYVLGAAHADSGTENYFYSCDKTDKNNSWGYVTADLASNTPIEFTLSGTAAALVATSTEVSARYLKPLAEKDFQMSASSQTVELKSDGTIYNNNTGETSWRLLYNKAGGLRWYSSNVSGSTNAYFYEVVAGGEVNYRTSCCADKVAAPTVTATKTSTTVTLTWAAVSGATGYELQWNGGAWTAATSGVVKSDLTPNTNYSWRVRATYDPPKCGADIASGSTTTNQVYHVIYAKGSGTGSCSATGSTTDDTAYEAGATVTLQSNGFTLVGHTFNEWTEDDEDITISSNQFTMPEHDVVITATWTPKVDKFYDRMHDGTDASHGGIADGDGKYYITREGCSYTVPSLTDNTSGATACHTKHYVLMGWTAESHLNSDGTLKTGHEGNVYTGGGTQTATGATYYAVWAEVEE